MEYKSTWLKITDFLNPLIVRVLRTRNYVVAWMQPSGRFCPRRIAVVACCIILSISLLLGGLGFGVYSLFFANPEDVDQDGYAIGDNSSVFGDLFTVDDADSMRAFLKNWALNGDEMHSDGVINILLIGDDARSGQARGRSDTMIIASLNKSKKQISLVSIPRDTFLYIQHNGEDRFDKINHSHIWGGADTLVPTIENNLKIKIDHWVTVGFRSFEKIIDILGGIHMDVTEAEAREVNTRPKTYRAAELPAGDNVLLNGKAALAYSRIRKIGGEPGRTDRQRVVLTKLIEKAKSANFEQVTQISREIFNNIDTDMGLTTMTNLGIQALTNGWANYSVESVELPQNKDLRQGVSLYNSYANPRRAISFWVIDFPRAAHDLQILLYGESNIVITEDTPSVLNFLSAPPRPTTTARSTTATTTAPPTTPTTSPSTVPTDTTMPTASETTTATTTDTTTEATTTTTTTTTTTSTESTSSTTTTTTDTTTSTTSTTESTATTPEENDDD